VSDLLEKVGFAPEQERSASFLLQDQTILESRTRHPAVEMVPLVQALASDPRLRDRLFALVPAEQDEYTRLAASMQSPQGYFIRVRAGQKVVFPIQTCFLIQTAPMDQVVHNVVIVEPDAEAHFINGCAANVHLLGGRHIGVTEYFIDEGATVTSTMIHSWGPEVEVYPRSAARIAAHGRFISNYIAMTKVKRIQMAPVAYLSEHALGEFYSTLLAPNGSLLDIGGVAHLNGDGSRAEIISRAVSEGGQVYARGKIVGNVNGSKGAMACNGLLISDDGMIHAIPELVGNVSRLELSHEASVGMISRDELSYLMASGIEEDRARELIIQGFLDIEIEGLPPLLKVQMKALVEKTKRLRTV
jgi:Fe-S cluster assembly scaffold protein SufB